MPAVAIAQADRTVTPDEIDAYVAEYEQDPHVTPVVDGVGGVSDTELAAYHDLVRATQAAGEPETSLAPGEMWSDTIGIPADVSKADADAAEIAIATEQDALPSINSLNSLDRLDDQTMARASNCRTFFFSPHQVCGAILAAYDSLGGQFGWLMHPVEPMYLNPDGQGYRQRFRNGFIYWHPNTGAHAVTTRSAVVWDRNGWEQGWLGYPTSAEVPVRGTTPQDGELNGWVQYFQGGRMYRTPLAQGAHVASINGLILDKWLAMGGPDSELGFPIADEAKTADGIGRFSVFQHGSIYWHPHHGAHPVFGEILHQWATAGSEMGTLGYPVEDPTGGSSLSVSQQFQGGFLSSPHVPVNLFGDLGRYSFGVLSPETFQPSIEGSSAVLENNDFRVSLTPGGKFDIGYDITFKNPSENPNFRILVGLPDGLHLESRYTSRVSVVNAAGQEIAAIVTPTSLVHSDNWVDIETQLNGNEVTFHLSGDESANMMQNHARAQHAELRVSGVAVGDAVSNYVGFNAGDHEKAVCINEPHDCARAFRSGAHEQAKAIGESLVLPPHGNEGDAARHCVWQGLTTNATNAGFASRMAQAHERDVISDPNGVYTPAQTAGMDIYNNYTGRQGGIRLDGKPEEIKNVCIRYALSARETLAPQNELPRYGNDLVVLKHDLN